MPSRLPIDDRTREHYILAGNRWLHPRQQNPHYVNIRNYVAKCRNLSSGVSSAKVPPKCQGRGLATCFLAPVEAQHGK
ncbi:hypothetical protein TYRP_003526 [Tyrophagus putrescentiae]|nr:hypothetical protein TYRP_003526 [Tyrophagus putrescentiae]